MLIRLILLYLLLTSSIFSQQYSRGQMRDSLNPEFWNNKLISLDGDDIDLSTYKGKYVFINVWGEWCGPCINEMEELKAAYKNNKNNIVFLGLLKPFDIVKAKRIIKNKKITWVNSIITNEMAKYLNIFAFPTNILIFPQGDSYIKEGIINRTFFDLNVK